MINWFIQRVNCFLWWWLGSSDNRKSTTGYGFMLSDKSLISWKSRKQPTIALSTCEAEYMSLRSWSKTWLVLIYIISLSCVTIKNPMQHERSKHIDIKYNFIKDQIKNGTININYVPTAQNWSVMFTKPVCKQ